MNSTAAAMPDFTDTSCWIPVTRCPLCDGTKMFEVRKAPDAHYGVSGLFPIFRCRDCGLQFLNPQPTPKYLETAYPKTYYSYTLKPRVRGLSQILQYAKKALRTILVYHTSETHDPRFERPGAMLDIGCGAGEFLLGMRAKGWQVKGVEVSSAAAAEGRERGNLDIFGGTLPGANLPSEHYDYVRSNHSFEHVDNPREVLREIRRIIKPDGYLFIGVPNLDSFQAKLFGRFWYYLGPPTHTFAYSPKSLTKFLEQEGFRVEKVGYNSDFSGICGSVQIFVNQRNGKPASAGWVINNPIFKLIGQWTAKITDLFEAGDCIEVIARPVAKKALNMTTDMQHREPV